MQNEKLSIIGSYGKLAKGIIKNDTRLKSLKYLCDRNSVKLEYFDFETAINRVDELSDPLVFLCQNISGETLTILTNQLPGKRKIICEEIREYVSDVSMISCSSEEYVKKTLAYLKSAKRENIALFGIDHEHILSKNFIENLKQYKSFYDITISDEDMYWNENTLETSGACLLENIKKYNAIICINDSSAVHIMQKAKESDFRSPEDIYVIGFGNTNIGQLIKPSLTTWTSEKETVGKQIFYIYKYLTKHPDIKKIKVTFESKLIIGGSTDFFELEGIHIVNNINIQNRIIPKERGHEDFERLNSMIMECTEEDYGILYGIKTGMSNEAISEELNMSVETVRYRIAGMTSKSGVQTKKHLSELLHKFNIV